VLEAVDGFDVEFMVYHGGGHSFLKAADENTSGKLFFLFFLLVWVGRLAEEGSHSEGEVGLAHLGDALS
jgi:hypothetical protein